MDDNDNNDLLMALSQLVLSELSAHHETQPT